MSDNADFNSPPPAAPSAAPGGAAAPMPTAPPEHPQAVLILILGILSVTGCFIMGPVALFMGLRARRQVEAAPNSYSNANLITIGWVCGLIGTIGLVFSFLYFLFIIFFAMA